MRRYVFNVIIDICVGLFLTAGVIGGLILSLRIEKYFRKWVIKDD